MRKILLNNHWQKQLTIEMSKPYFINLMNKIKDEYDKYTCFPPYHLIFRAFEIINDQPVKVVILGQDPYFNEGQADGLAFSVNKGFPIPKSLQNIFKELSNDIVEFKYPTHGNLDQWAKQGILLLNNVLTVREKQPGSHYIFGWQTFTDQIIRFLNEQENPIVFMLWGKEAVTKSNLINKDKHLVLTAPHPSPLAAYRGFFGCHHFSIANHFLLSNGIKPISWQIL